MQTLPPDSLADSRLLTSAHANEDAAIVTMPSGMALVQSLDFFTPIVNDPYAFGAIAAANAFSDLYAMGATPWTAMNIVGFPLETTPKSILEAILAGGADIIAKANAVLAGGHSVTDQEIKYGLSVTGIVDPKHFATNQGLKPGDQLILTKPLGTGILATAVKARWENEENLEKTIIHWASQLNSVAGQLIQMLQLKAATDITGFGLGGHLTEMAQASRVTVTLNSKAIPIMENAYTLAAQGLVPAGSYANRQHRAMSTQIAPTTDPILVDIIFDAQTSGGIVLAVPEPLVSTACSYLQDNGVYPHHIGEVSPLTNEKLLHIF